MKRNISIPKSDLETFTHDGKEYTRVTVNTPKTFYIDHCHTVMPNNVDTQEIIVVARRFSNGEDIELIFTPEDWLDTFTPTMYERVKDNYIKYIKDKK